MGTQGISKRRLTQAEKLSLIERALKIGDSWMAQRNLQDWGEALEADEDKVFRARTAFEGCASRPERARGRSRAVQSAGSSRSGNCHL